MKKERAQSAAELPSLLSPLPGTLKNRSKISHNASEQLSGDKLQIFNLLWVKSPFPLMYFL